MPYRVIRPFIHHARWCFFLPRPKHKELGGPWGLQCRYCTVPGVGFQGWCCGVEGCGAQLQTGHARYILISCTIYRLCVWHLYTLHRPANVSHPRDVSVYLSKKSPFRDFPTAPCTPHLKSGAGKKTSLQYYHRTFFISMYIGVLYVSVHIFL